ncbi:MAG: polysaccharide deacetylase family protein [Gemmatimonadales bacterium]
MRYSLLLSVFVLIPHGCGRGAPVAKPGWQWSLDSVRAVVHAVRAGRSLRPARWPGGARVAVLLSFDVDNETISLSSGKPTVAALSRGEYGARAGLRRVTDLLDRHQIPATFFIPAVSLILAPEMAALIKRSGRHEFGVHGWIHENNATLTSEVERELVQRAVDTLSHFTGARPVGYRAPSWDMSPNTLRIIRDLGFLYDSSLMADDDPYELLADGRPTGMVELPVGWILDDASLLEPRGNSYSPPGDVLQVWMDEFDKAYEEGGMFLLTLHPQVIGHRSRIMVLERLVDYIRRKPGVWFATHRAAAEYVNPGLAVIPESTRSRARIARNRHWDNQGPGL